ncbi:type II secretion system F family protein [Calderihabitans maritimus]|uniref:Type II secretion system protein GspF domain-containing protein n=1 Tax=Calderihabitans maritimus TaxID=1246530 RepID=A0A1Z5HU32_9FIRM|nr:type II secretion system F family protein [Calderihabitans maritimus]GAW92841.1 hypothetical protein KKC1_19900 [Calderihabitans maritimus]
MKLSPELGLVILSFTSAFFIGVALSILKDHRQARLRERYSRYSVEPNKDIKKQLPEFKVFIDIAGKLFKTKIEWGYLWRKLDLVLIQADAPFKVQEFLALELLSAMAVAGLFLTQRYLLGLSVLAGTLLFPALLLNRARAKRKQKLENQLPDTLILMANALQAGFSFTQAMEMISREMAAPIGNEFARTLQEIKLGSSTEQALLRLAQRTESSDVELMTTAVLIQRQVGGNLAEILNNIASTIKERIRIRGEIKTLTAQGRISGFIIGSLPLFLLAFLLIFNPQYIAVLFSTRAGRLLLGWGVISEVLGVILIRKIVNVQI